ncbi:hypothetical protein [Bifidobacterium rousetti]|nr:hypothetical protein [Bifidobacterium rousetti]
MTGYTPHSYLFGNEFTEIVYYLKNGDLPITNPTDADTTHRPAPPA